KDHHMRHPRGHLGDRASAQGARGCAWRDDQFGRGQNPVLGWSDPTFAHGSVAKVVLGVAPAHEEIPSDVLPACVAEVLDEARVEESVKTQLELYAEFIDASPSYVITEAPSVLFRKDDDFRRWADQHANNHDTGKAKGDILAKTV